MIRKFFIAAFCAGLAFGAAAQSQAAFVVSNGDIQAGSTLTIAPGPPPAIVATAPLVDITRISMAGGRLYTNQVTGDAFDVGSIVRTVGIVNLSTAINGTNTPMYNPDASNIWGIFAIEGTVVGIDPGNPALVAAKFDIGRLFLVSQQTGNPLAATFDINNAATWNFGNQFAEYTLLPPEPIVDGFPLPPLNHDSGHFTQPDASKVNVSAVNTVNQMGAQGIFVVGEDSTPLQNSGLQPFNPGLGAFSGDNWLRNVDVSPLHPGKLSEGFAIVSNQIALSSGFSAPNAADLVVLNAIGVVAGFTGAFATTGTGTQSDYTPTGLGFGTGDFVADLTGEAYIGYHTPEPGTLLVFALNGCALAIYGYRRRR